MVRLDVWLVEHEFFSSRQTAKRAIRAGTVLLNGKAAKPSSRVKPSDSVIVSEKALDRPSGYWKLKQIDEFLGESSFVKPGARVLDIGSSAGGFVQYLYEHGVCVVGVEVSPEFIAHLRALASSMDHVRIVQADAFKIDPAELGGQGQFDAILIDVTTSPEGTMTLVKKYLGLLRNPGTMVVAFKTKPAPDVTAILVHRLEALNLSCRPITLSESRHEVHIVAFRT
ncbi:MAG: S4 domain-containing protein [Candidatus Thorarchaeota archaeon]